MELDPDMRRLSALQEHDEERSIVWWISVIAIGVLIGNILSYGAYEMYQRWQLHGFMESVDAMLDKQHQRNMEQSKLIARQNIERQRLENKKRAVDAQLQKTCTFWRQQVQQENTATNRNYRDVACARVNGLFR